MERLNTIILLFVLSVYGCSTTDMDNPRQVFFSNCGDTIALCSNENNDKLLILSHGKKGSCSIINEPQPYIHNVAEDTIFIWYDNMHGVNDLDTLITVYINRVNVGHSVYMVKGVHNYFYNGNAIGHIDGVDWDYNYSYLIDSVVHLKDSIYFIKDATVLYAANQRDVTHNHQKGYWEAFYTHEVVRENNIYKMKNCIHFVKPYNSPSLKSGHSSVFTI